MKGGRRERCQDGRSLPCLLRGQRAGRHLLYCTRAAQPAIMPSTHNTKMPHVLGNTLKARSRSSVAIQKLHHVFDERVVATKTIHQKSVRQGEKQNRSTVRLNFFKLTTNANPL